jgi:hypothetical protein
MALGGSTSDQAKALRADVEHPSMAPRNRAEVVVADEIGFITVCSLVRRAFLCGVDSLSGKFYRIGWGHPLSGTKEMWMAPFVCSKDS